MLTARRLSPVLAAAMAMACGSSGVTEPDPRFDQAALLSALQGRGLAASSTSTVDQPFFSVSGRVLTVDGQDVQVFEYPSAEAARTEASRIRPDGSGTATTLITWIAPPHFYRRDRVIALYVGTDARMLAALTAIMGTQFAGR